MTELEKPFPQNYLLVASFSQELVETWGNLINSSFLLELHKVSHPYEEKKKISILFPPHAKEMLKC